MDGIQANAGATANATGQAHGHHRHGRNPQEMFKKLDTNGDGSVDLTELQAAQKNGKGPDPAKMMQAMDANGDGKIDESENEAAIAKMKERFAQHCKRHPSADGVAGTNPEAMQSLSDVLKQNGGGETDTVTAKLQMEIQVTAQYTAEGQGTNAAQGLLDMKG